MLIHFEMPTEYQTIFDAQSRNRSRGRFPMDVLATENGTIVYAELPGVRKEDIQITFEDEVLTITGKRSEKSIPEDARIILHEQLVREFHRSVAIDHPVDADAVNASLENGLLAVHVPKAAAARPRTISIR